MVADFLHLKLIRKEDLTLIESKDLKSKFGTPTAISEIKRVKEGEREFVIASYSGVRFIRITRNMQIHIEDESHLDEFSVISCVVLNKNVIAAALDIECIVIVDRDTKDTFKRIPYGVKIDKKCNKTFTDIPEVDPAQYSLLTGHSFLLLVDFLNLRSVHLFFEPYS